MRCIQTIIAASVLVSMTGCLNDTMNCVDDIEFHIRNHCLALSAWHDSSSCYEDVEYKRHFKKGFIKGYMEHAASGAVCPPALPPRCYWKVHYANYSGKQKQLAWYNGYEHGLLAAQQDGVETDSNIYTPIESPPLCPEKAVHSIVDENGNPTPAKGDSNSVPPSPIQKAPAAAEVPETATEPVLREPVDIEIEQDFEELIETKTLDRQPEPATQFFFDEEEQNEVDSDDAEDLDLGNEFSANQTEDRPTFSFAEYRAIAQAKPQNEEDPTFNFAEYRAFFESDSANQKKQKINKEEESKKVADKTEIRGFFEE